VCVCVCVCFRCEKFVLLQVGTGLLVCALSQHHQQCELRVNIFIVMSQPMLFLSLSPPCSDDVQTFSATTQHTYLDLFRCTGTIG